MHYISNIVAKLSNTAKKRHLWRL